MGFCQEGEESWEVKGLGERVRYGDCAKGEDCLSPFGQGFYEQERIAGGSGCRFYRVWQVSL